MKKIIMIIGFALFCISGKSEGPEGTWVFKENEKIQCEKIFVKGNFARVIFGNGENMKIPIALIKSYSINGRVYDKLILFKNKLPTGQFVFMERLKDNGTSRLYLYSGTDYNSQNPFKKCHGIYEYQGDSIAVDFSIKNIDHNMAILNSYSYK